MKIFSLYLRKQVWFIFAVLLIILYKFMDNIIVVFNQIDNFFNVLTPFIIGFTLAYLVYPLSTRIQSVYDKSTQEWLRKRSYSASVMSAYLIFIVSALIILRFGIPALVSSLAGLLQRIPTYYSQIVTFINELSEKSNIFEYVDLSGMKTTISIDKIINILTPGNFMIYINSLWGIVSLMISLLMGLVVGAYFLLDKEDIHTLIKRILGLFLSDGKIALASSYIAKINDIFYDFFYGISMEAVVVGTIAGIFFYIFQIPFPLVMALIVTIFNVIPYFGPFVAIVIIALVSLLTTGVSQAVTVIIFLIVLNQIDGMFIGPKILGNSLEMSPLWVIFAILIGGGYFGILGMFLGIPIIAVFRMLLLDYLDYHDRIKG